MEKRSIMSIMTLFVEMTPFIMQQEKLPAMEIKKLGKTLIVVYFLTTLTFMEWVNYWKRIKILMKQE